MENTLEKFFVYVNLEDRARHYQQQLSIVVQYTDRQHWHKKRS